MADKIIFSTLVKYRNAGEQKVHEKEFTGENHGLDAQKFVADHVCALTDEQYAKVKNPKDFVQRVMPARSDAPAAKMWFRLKNIWNWHVFEPVWTTVTV